MSALILSELRHTLKRLQAQSSTLYSASDKQELRNMLSSTIKALHRLYPDHLSLSQRHQLLQNLSMLEQQFLSLTPPTQESPTTWQALQQSLKASIETTLTDEAQAHR